MRRSDLTLCLISDDVSAIDGADALRLGEG
jgi:hypothetical protein